MINKTDLRIGNSVMYDNRIFQISAITDEFPLLNTAEFGIGVVDWNNIHPIPITEEAMVKMGFECEYESPMHSMYHHEKSKISYYFWHQKKEQDLQFFTVQIPITSIHSLQNAIYALTQTELSYD